MNMYSLLTDLDTYAHVSRASHASLLRLMPITRDLLFVEITPPSRRNLSSVLTLKRECNHRNGQ